MRVRRKTIWGRINSNGELEVRLADLDEFCRMHPNRSIILRAEIQSKEPSSKLKAYFFGYVIKEVQRAFYDAGEDCTEEQTYNRIRAVCPLFLSEERVEGKWKVRMREWEELDSAEAVEVVAWIQRYMAENYYTILNDPI